ncbi:molybdate ABC transporter substrate-binding protein [Cellvibrio zantedeschiae]|uniref:Molybdate ABC transporter substrate-binding protein n=1 Tax=Cellvibrio zantedeschiae TaxID=1237077 RepID=A0ABQ3AP15_9GAMM|nr:molybdate ABC transporter substrate-binding protein [Cellvibrio zantedeschiae]GGY62665.1 molybdate ABC transporter substrate-binding protein [Cellvibrio zantedeschiae]
MMQALLVLPKSGAFLKAKIKLLCVITLGLLSNWAAAGEVNVYAAASLTDAVTELSSAYQKTHPDVAIKKSFAGSSTLAKQIENGAPADIFISADNDWADYLGKRGLLVSESRKKLLSNDLVLIAPLASDVKITLGAGFNFNAAFTGRLCTGDTASVPVGKYAKQSLTHYGWWDKSSARIVGTEDVRTALAFVERAECSLGIVYKTDAQLSKKVKVVATFPAASHAPIEYPGALTKNAGADSKAFWEFLQSDDAKAVFARYGFVIFN